jgi:hypothetical protein
VKDGDEGDDWNSLRLGAGGEVSEWKRETNLIYVCLFINIGKGNEKLGGTRSEE